MVQAQFAQLGTPLQNGMATPLQVCGDGQATFIIAGMKASATYAIALEDTQVGASGNLVTFTTGAIPKSVLSVLPALTPSGLSTAPEKVFLESFIVNDILPVAYDSTGAVIWYNYPPAIGGINQLMRPLPGGYLMMAQQNGVIQEIDLLGNVLRETNVAHVGEQLSAPPFSTLTEGVRRLADFNHDAYPLPDGSIATLSVIEALANQGDGVTDVLGDAIVVLDSNWQVSWVWNSFTHLDIRRKATQNDMCASFTVGCPELRFVPQGTNANDWTHANALTTTDDGNLLLSLRNQDWILKIDYASRSGNILWRFGAGGDFTASGDASEQVLFPSHQHDASLHGSKLMIFDNANATYQQFGGSRGLVWNINEAARTAYLYIDARMGTYSGIVGSARTLMNGNLYFLSGFVNPSYSQSIEFSNGAPYAKPLLSFTATNSAYRSFRMTDLYTPSY